MDELNAGPVNEGTSYLSYIDLGYEEGLFCCYLHLQLTCERWLTGIL